jgi:hypothetical protein
MLESQGARDRRAATITPFGHQPSQVHVVRNAQLNGLAPDPLFNCGRFDGKNHVHAIVEVARHRSGAAEIDFFVTALIHRSNPRDADTVEARQGEYSRMHAAFESGAQFLSRITITESCFKPGIQVALPGRCPGSLEPATGATSEGLAITPE